VCTVENSSYSEWKIEVVNTDLRTQYLNNNDYIYFTHSQANETMIIDIEKAPIDIAYIRNTCDNENEFMVSSIFVVEIERKKNFKTVYLKHFLTNRYFPFGKKEEDKQNCELIPLLAHKKNQCPPFRILFGGKEFTRKDKTDKETLLHGFWLNKIPKTEIAEITSIEYVDEDASIEYLIGYLKHNTKRRQNILREFQFIPYLISKLTAAEGRVTQEYGMRSEPRRSDIRLSDNRQSHLN
jgi:hypothetical protein